VYELPSGTNIPSCFFIAIGCIPRGRSSFPLPDGDPLPDGAPLPEGAPLPGVPLPEGPPLPTVYKIKITLSNNNIIKINKYSQTCFSVHLYNLHMYYVTLFQFSFTVHFILIKSVFSDHLSYVILFQCYLGRSLDI